MDIRLKSIHLENFKCHKSLTITLDGRDASIYGDNATGKTSVYDALTWLLFGKDSAGNGEKNIEIKPLAPDGSVKDHQAITEVEAVLLADGEEISLKRTYDSSKPTWHRESGIQATAFCSCRDELYCSTIGGKIVTMLGSGYKDVDALEWFAETGIINASLPERQYLTKISIRLVLEPGSSLSILAQYDSCGVWENIGTMSGVNLRSFTFPVRPRRCDHLRIRLEGRGKAMIFSITKTFSGGSDKP